MIHLHELLKNPSGGPFYHYLAAKHALGRWAPFRAELGRWLEAWRPRATRLLLIGPSGGYCLQPAFLARFESVYALDLDPWAPRAFALRFAAERAAARVSRGAPVPALPGGRVRFGRADYLSPHPARGFDIGRIAALRADFPDHAILFCNILGQLKCLFPREVEAPAFEEWKRQLPRALGGDWASFHDRLSGGVEVGPEARLALDRAQAGAESSLEDWPLPAGEYADHLTGGLFPGFHRAYFSWNLFPGRYHLIEAVRSPPSRWAEALPDAPPPRADAGFSAHPSASPRV